MGCVSSKNLNSPTILSSAPDSPIRSTTGSDSSKYGGTKSDRMKLEDHTENDKVDSQDSIKSDSSSIAKRRGFGIKIGSFRLTQGGGDEQNAPAWPAWLSAVASEAVEGWLPLRSNMFQKLEKVKLCFPNDITS